MAYRITVESVAEKARAGSIQAMLSERFPRAHVSGVSVTNSYAIDKVLSATEQEKVRRALTNPVIETSSFSKVIAPEKFAVALEIGFLPGVTDNVGNTVRQMVEDATGKKFKGSEAVYSSLFVFLSGKVTEAEAAQMALELHNPLIEEAIVTPFWEWKRGRIPIRIPRVHLAGSTQVDSVDLHLNDEELAKVGKEGIENADGSRRGPLALSVHELVAIREYFDSIGRLPTDIELEALAQTWSEHCQHTIFNDPLDDIEEGIYRRYIKGATQAIRKAKGKKDFCVSVFKDNSGGIVFNDTYVVTHKVETHNSPSALDPYGGAMTGIVGVNRDTLGFGLGAKPIANIYGFCIGNPTDTRPLYRDSELKERLLPPRRILEGVVRGINGGGNQSGIPTPLGFVYTDDSYRGKPLVFAGTVGLIPRKQGKRDLAKKQAKAGDLIVMIGGRVGLDGIHGATFSSEALRSGSPATAVQIGDPITQKRFSDAVIREARDLALYDSITDNGAGGLSSSVGEMAKESGGCDVDLALVPLKYPGLAPWQIWISESQERMTLAVPKKSWKKLKSIFDKHGVEATRIGEFTKSGSCVVRYGAKKILDVELAFLHDGRPKKRLESAAGIVSTSPLPAVKEEYAKTLLALLSRPNIGSYEFISSQYDHEVQGTSVTKPLQGPGRINADAGVLKPLPNDDRGIVLSHGYAPTYSEIDTYAMAAAAIDTAVRNAVCAGAPLDHLAILDNFCWSSSNDPARLWQLKEAARACYETAIAYGTPYISGKDSMFNDFRGFDAKGKALHIAALPTLLVSAIGVMKDVRKAVTMDLNAVGDTVYLIGETAEEFGGSEYARLHGLETGLVPETDAVRNLKAYKAIAQTIDARLVSSALGLSRGGLAVAAAKMVMAGHRGMDLALPKGDARTLLFSESQGRVLLTVPKVKTKKFEALLKGVKVTKLGTVTEKRDLSIRSTKNVKIALPDLLKAYRKPFKKFEV